MRKNEDETYIRLVVGYGNNPFAKKRNTPFAIIVKDGNIICDGVNRTTTLPDGCEIHPEANAIVKLAMIGAKSCLGATMYVIDEPCVECAKLIVQSGIKRVVYHRACDKQHGGVELLKTMGLEVKLLAK